jgi:hypothetical protein
MSHVIRNTANVRKTKTVGTGIPSFARSSTFKIDGLADKTITNTEYALFSARIAADTDLQVDPGGLKRSSGIDKTLDGAAKKAPEATEAVDEEKAAEETTPETAKAAEGDQSEPTGEEASDKTPSKDILKTGDKKASGSSAPSKDVLAGNAKKSNKK